MIEKVHGHSFYSDMLLKNGWALDIGCNDFVFSKYLIDKGLNVIGVDPLDGVSVPKLSSEGKFHYLKAACVGIKDSDFKVYYEYAHSEPILCTIRQRIYITLFMVDMPRIHLEENMKLKY
jgi:hypothetical protein